MPAPSPGGQSASATLIRMRLRSHIAAQTGLLVGMSLLLSLVLAREVTRAFGAEEQLRVDARDAQSVERLTAQSEHLMLIGELVLSGDSSDLSAMLETHADHAQEIVRGLSMSALCLPDAELLGELGADIRALQDVASAADRALADGREERLAVLHETFRRHSSDLRSRMDRLATEVELRASARRAEGDEVHARTRAVALACALALAALIALAWSHLTWLIGRPLVRLTERARAAGQGEEFRTDVGGPEEVRSLASSFDAVLGGLASSNQDLEGAVRERTAELERALSARSAFLANTSHELRTPLNAILGFTELLGDEGLREPERREFLEHVEAGARHLLALIEDVLDLSRIDAGSFRNEPEPTCLRRVLDQVIAILEGNAKKRGLSLTLDAVGLPEFVVIDETRMRQVLINLAGNALKFTEEGGVRLRARWAAGRLRIAVIDSGKGIPADMLEHIFEPFEQVDSSDTRRAGGTGLGLAISRKIVEHMGGELVVESTINVGSTFTLEVAAPQAFSAPEPAAPQPGSPQPAGPATKPAPPSIHDRVLVVDDVVTNRLVAKRLLERLGAEVSLAEGGQEAVEAALHASRAGTPFDFVLMDLQMPNVDGYEATRRLREQGYEGVVLALSAAVMREQREAAETAGCDGFLSKPISSDGLSTALARHRRSAGAAA